MTWIKDKEIQNYYKANTIFNKIHGAIKAGIYKKRQLFKLCNVDRDTFNEVWIYFKAFTTQENCYQDFMFVEYSGI